MFTQNLRTLLHCLLASSVAVENPMPFSFLNFVHDMFLFFFSLEIFRIVSLSLAFCNSTDIPWCGSFYHLSCWLLSGICIPSVLGHVLVFWLWSLPSCCFLHSISGTPVVGCWSSSTDPPIFSSFLFCCLFLHLAILLPRIFCLLLFSNPSHWNPYFDSRYL